MSDLKRQFLRISKFHFISCSDYCPHRLLLCSVFKLTSFIFCPRCFHPKLPSSPWPSMSYFLQPSISIWHNFAASDISNHHMSVQTLKLHFPTQGNINRETCSSPEPTQDHVLTSAYVKHFCTVATNAVNIECLREKKLSLTSLQ